VKALMQLESQRLWDYFAAKSKGSTLAGVFYSQKLKLFYCALCLSHASNKGLINWI